MKNKLVEPHIIQTNLRGNTTVNIADNFIRTDPVEIEAILAEARAVSLEIKKNRLMREQRKS